MMQEFIPILQIGTTLLATIQTELRDSVVERFQEDVLNTIARDRPMGLVIDIRGLELVDTHVARTLVDTGRMARLMGVETVLVGMRPEVAANLIRMGFPMETVRTAATFDDGLELLSKLSPRRWRR